MAAILTRDLGTKRKRTKQGRKYGKTSLREELQPCNCKILGRKYGKGSPREELQPYNCKILGRKYGKGSPREELQPYKLSQRLYQHRPQIAKTNFCAINIENSVTSARNSRQFVWIPLAVYRHPAMAHVHSPKDGRLPPPQPQQWHHSPRLGRPSPFPQRSTLQWHPAMAPSNGTTSTPPKFAVTLPRYHSTLQWHPAMAPRPFHQNWSSPSRPPTIAHYNGTLQWHHDHSSQNWSSPSAPTIAHHNGTLAWHHDHSTKIGRHPPPPNHSTLQRHPAIPEE